MNPHDDAPWERLAGLWQAQAFPGPDLARLERDVRRGRRREIALSTLDVASFAIAAGVVANFVLQRGTTRVAVVAGIMLALGSIFTAWSLWNRRASYRLPGLSPHALVDTAIARARAARRFWRINSRVMFALAIAVALLALGQAMGWLDGLRPDRWWLALIANIPVVALSLWWARRRDGQLRERLDHLEALRRQLAN